MNEQNVWSLIKGGFFEEACNLADLEYEKTKSVLHLRNKVFALFHLKKFNEVIKLTQEIIVLRKGETDIDFIFCGIANWILGKKTDALDILQSGEKAKYTDLSGGIELLIILFFFSIKIDDDVLKNKTVKKITRLSRFKQSDNWPGPLGGYIIEKLSQEKLYSLITEKDALKQRQLCQTHFVIGLKELEKGNIKLYKSKLIDVTDLGSTAYLEPLYYLSAGELSLMN